MSRKDLVERLVVDGLNGNAVMTASEIYDKQKKTVAMYLKDHLIPLAFLGDYDVIKERLGWEFHLNVEFDVKKFKNVNRFDVSYEKLLCYVKYDKMYFYEVMFYGEAGNVCFVACTDIHELTDKEVEMYYGGLR